MQVVSIHKSSQDLKFKLPYFISPVQAGFPSPAEDYLQKKLDLNEHLISKPHATFFVKVSGDSMQGAGISEGDLLIVDRSKEAHHRSIVIAVVNGEFTVKRLVYQNDKIFLMPENSSYSPLCIQEGMDFEIWGVVIHVIHTPK